MTIVTSAQRPKRPRQSKAKDVALTGPALVTAARKHGSKQSVELKDDPKADARVMAWFAKNVRPPGT
jgi:hypothetical protein